MGYYGASHYHTNPLLELTHDPDNHYNSVIVATKYVTAYTQPIAAKFNEKSQYHGMSSQQENELDVSISSLSFVI